MIDFRTEILPGSVAVVRTRGRLDKSTVSYFFNCLGDLKQNSNTNESAKHVIFDCEEVEFVSSDGIAALSAATTTIRKGGGQLYLTQLDSTIAKAFELTKHDTLLAIHPSTEELLLSIQSHA